ncbi:hypothetical protein C8R45DRAFT_935210 [Mycena sanguinolenta]|nr:hypothetical protein C8R45DRAFT_935210 [Mycena sanguinolenta]
MPTGNPRTVVLSSPTRASSQAHNSNAEQLQKEPRRFSGRFKELLKLTSVGEGIKYYRAKTQELRSNFILMAGVDTNFIVHDTHFTMKQIYEAFPSGGLPRAPCLQLCSFLCVVAILGMSFKQLPTADETSLGLRSLADVRLLLPAAADSKFDFGSNQTLSDSDCQTATENIGLTHLDLCQGEEIEIETTLTWEDLWQLEEAELKQAVLKKGLFWG